MKNFTITELKRLKYMKMKLGMTEQQAREEIANLIKEVEKNRANAKLKAKINFKQAFNKLRGSDNETKEI